MKAKLILIALLIIVTIGFAQQNVDWKGTIEYEGEIRIVTNPKEPLYGELIFELEEDLSIGNENDENSSFFRRVSVEVDSNGNLLVLDQGNFRLLKFDKEGNYIKTFGRKGQGPGELQMPRSSFMDSKNRYYVLDSGQLRINIYDENSDYQSSLKITRNTILWGVTEDLNVLMRVTSREKDRMPGKIHLILADKFGKTLKTIASYPSNYPPMINGTIGIGNPYTHRFVFCPINEFSGVYGYSGIYRLYFVNSNGDIARIVEQDVIPVEISKKEKEELINDRFASINKRHPELKKSDIRNGIIFPKHKPFFQSFLKDDKHIYVRRFKRSSDTDKNVEFDLFNTEGYFLFKVIMPFYPTKIKDGYVYRFKSDRETGYIKIVRYKIKNWDQIKDGSFPS